MIKVGLVGCGRLGQRHLEAYSGVPNAKVVAVCDVEKRVAMETSIKYKVPQCFTLYRYMLDNQGIDTIDVCVPTVEHHKIILEALECGKDVFCEKPLTYDLNHVEKIRQKVKETKRKLMVGYLFRHHPTFQRLSEILEDEILGNVTYATFRIGGRGGHKLWKHTKNGGGAMLETLVHCIDLAFFFFKEFKEVTPLFMKTIKKQRVINGRQQSINAEDFVMVHLKSKSNVHVFCQADQVTPSYMNIVEVHGDNGSFFGSILEHLPTVVYCKEGRGEYFAGNNLIPTPRINLMRKELQYFVSMLEGKKDVWNSVDTSIKILEVIQKLKENHRK